MKVFIAACLIFVVSAQTTVNPLRVNFDAMDQNKDGFVDKAELTGVFTIYDKDMDGKVSFAEFLVGYSTATGASQEASAYVFFLLDHNEDGFFDTAEGDSLFNTYDANNDAKVSFDEYSAVMVRLATQLAYLSNAEKKLTAIFAKADANGDGKLSQAELNSVFISADANGDGMIDLNEFVNMWTTESGESVERATALFGFLDRDNNGKYGTPEERTYIWGKFDANDDGFVSKEEYNTLFLFLAARLQRAEDAKAVVG